MTDLSNAAEDLSRFFAGARGWRVTLQDAGPFHCLSDALQLEAEPAKLVLSIRTHDRIWIRRILAYELVDERTLRLQLGRRGRSDAMPAWIVAEPSGVPAAERRAHRRVFIHALKASLLRAFRDAQFLSLHRNPPVSPLYWRGALRRSSGVVAVVALWPGAAGAEGEGLPAEGLLWCDRLRRAGVVVTELYLLQRGARHSVTRRRLRHIHSPGLSISLYELCPGAGGLYAFRRVPIPPDPSPPAGPERAAWPRPAPYRAGDLLLRLVQLAPALIRRHARPEGYDSLRLRGLEFARVGGHRRDVITFGVRGGMQRLTEATWPDLERLVQEILSIRRADSANPRHPFYTLQPERWLESVLMDDIQRLAPELDGRFVYPQVPVCMGDRRGLTDILTVGADGRLVVIEVKATEDRDMPLQGLDYWSAVAWHHRRHEFQRRGYFPGVALNPSPPRLYLVAPLLRLHKTYRLLAGALNPALAPVLLGLNLDWRRKLKVLRRFP